MKFGEKIILRGSINIMALNPLNFQEKDSEKDLISLF
jgi:hypothetical protein